MADEDAVASGFAALGVVGVVSASWGGVEMTDVFVVVAWNVD